MIERNITFGSPLHCYTVLQYRSFISKFFNTTYCMLLTNSKLIL